MPTLVAVLLNPSLLFHWNALSKLFMANLWVEFGKGVDENGREEKQRLLMTPGNEPEGVVLDLGAGEHLLPISCIAELFEKRALSNYLGHGHTLNYLDRTRVTHYIALEPNILMHSRIRKAADEAGYRESDGSLVILSCGAEDSASILSSLATAGLSTTRPPVDTIISIHTLCTVPDPQRTVRYLVRDVLKPGGILLMYEHVLNPREDARWWQKLWAPFWAILFDGCRMDRETDVILRSLEVESADGAGKENAWKEWKTWGKTGETEESLFWHIAGRFVKK